MASSSSSRFEKRCHYEVLGISKDATQDEIRSSYKRLALMRHPDKLMNSEGISEAEATAQFQELKHAYDVLKDPKDRAWYDSHRSQILFSDNSSKSRGVPGGSVPDLFAFFSVTKYSGYSDTGRGFYKVYFDVFNSIYVNEMNFARKLGLSIDAVKEAPIMGNLQSPYTQVTAFYNYWKRFSTVMDFSWLDEYDVMDGPNRKSRRLMAEKNNKMRKRARNEFNDTVRGLAAFVKRRDKRVIDMKMKKDAEMEAKKAEEKKRKKMMEKEKLERAMNYEEPDWVKGQEEEVGDDAADDDAKKNNEQLYCIVCSKKFKSEKQWKNHEQSKKHKEKVAELRATFSDVEEEQDSEDEEEIDEPLESPETMEELHEKFQEGLNIDDEEEGEEKDDEEEVVGEADGTDEEYFMAEESVKGSSEDEDEEMALLKKMVSEKINKRKNVVSRDEDEVQVETESDPAETSDFDKQKSTGRNRRNKKERNKRNAGKDMTDDASKVQNSEEDGNTDDNVNATDIASGTFENSQKEEAGPMEYDNRKTTGRRRRSKKDKDKNNLGGLTEMNSEAGDAQDRKEDKEESETFEDQNENKKSTRSKKSLRGMKTKGTAKRNTNNSNNECDRCGEEFESRTKLHKHLADSGHATVKSR